MDSKYYKKKATEETHQLEKQTDIPTEVINSKLRKNQIVEEVTPVTQVGKSFQKIQTEVIHNTPAAEFSNLGEAKIPTAVMKNSLAQNTWGDTPKNITNQQAIVIGQLFGKYMIEHELGRGGMGVVYKATDTQLKRTVALKVLRKDDTTDIKRFMRESAAMAQLEHNNITKLYEFGTSPQPFFTMEYIDGFTLAHFIEEKKVPPLFLLDVMIKVCDALAHAHKHDILHRDIKPSNIMISSDGEPKVMDFGVAKISQDRDNSLSKTGDIMGTILYMAPEQLDGNATKKSDIYSIGATMYESLTHCQLYQGNTYHNLMIQILRSYPIPPRQLNPNISPYMEAVCLKCLAKKQHHRYNSFKQLVRELKNLKNHNPIIAKKYTAWDALKNMAYKRKTLSVSIVVALSVFVVSFAFMVNAWQREKFEKENTKVVLNKVMKVLEYATNRYSTLREDEQFSLLFSQIFADLEEYGEERDWNLMKGSVLHKSGERRKGIAYYNKQIQKNPNDERAYNNRGAAYFDLYQYDLALRDYNKAMTLNPENDDFYNNRGILYFTLEKYDLALRDYNKAISLNPNNEKSHVNLGRLYAKQKKYDLAFQSYSKALKINPRYGGVYASRGNYYFAHGQYDLAFRDYNRIIELNPKSEVGYCCRARLYFRQKKYDLALADCNEALLLKPDYQGAYMVRTDVYYKMQKEDLALQDHNKLIAINPHYQHYYSRGLFFYRLKKYDLALDDYNKTIELKANFFWAYTMRGHLYLQMKKYDLALNDHNKSLQLNPNFYEAYLNRGYLYYILKKYTLAVPDLEKATVSRSTRKQAHANLAHCYKELKNYKKARYHENKHLELKK